LRSALARYLAVSRGVIAGPEQILITHGFQGALGLLTLAFPRARVWLEEPGYYLAREALLLGGARVRAVPVDEQGMDPRRAARREQPALIFVTASHQMPLGIALSLNRRLELLSLARRTGAFIVEDDYDGEFHYAGPPLPALASLERAAPVIYAGTLSKVMFPALRLGYLVVPEPLRERLARVAALLGPTPGTLLQLAVADFLSEGHFARHIKRMRHLYAERRTALLTALRKHACSQLTLVESPGGLHVLARFPEDARIDDRKVVEQARALGLAPASFSACYHQPHPSQQGLLLGFPPLPVRSAEASVLRLVHAIEAAQR
jgi:GntR family transcriptional regulator/MocR family aminotransferase